MKKYFILTAIIFFSSSSSFSQGTPAGLGLSNTILGFGLSKCEQFNSADSNLKLDYLVYAEGELTGLNIFSKKDFLEIFDQEAMSKWLSNYCMKNPEHHFASTVINFSKTLIKNK